MELDQGQGEFQDILSIPSSLDEISHSKKKLSWQQREKAPKLFPVAVLSKGGHEPT